MKHRATPAKTSRFEPCVQLAAHDRQLLFSAWSDLQQECRQVANPREAKRAGRRRR